MPHTSTRGALTSQTTSLKLKKKQTIERVQFRIRVTIIGRNGKKQTLDRFQPVFVFTVLIQY